MIWVALHGYARTGKDALGEILIRRYALARVAFGDIIKRECRDTLIQYTGIDPLACDDQQKQQIRGFLVEYGYAHYNEVFDEFFASIQGRERVVNTRIFRLEECREWVRQGGVVLEVTRPEHGPAEYKEELELERVRDAGLIYQTIANDGDLALLETRGCAACEQAFPLLRGQPPHNPLGRSTWT